MTAPQWTVAELDLQDRGNKAVDAAFQATQDAMDFLIAGFRDAVPDVVAVERAERLSRAIRSVIAPKGGVRHD